MLRDESLLNEDKKCEIRKNIEKISETLTCDAY